MRVYDEHEIPDVTDDELEAARARGESVADYAMRRLRLGPYRWYARRQGRDARARDSRFLTLADREIDGSRPATERPRRFTDLADIELK